MPVLLKHVPAFPFFIPTDHRPVTEEERAVLKVLLSEQSAAYKQQLNALTVVGRCGCGVCPTIFFRVHTVGDKERNLVTYAGRDGRGLVGAVLLEKEGMLSQLEFYSIDGHDPWSIPSAQSLEPY